MAKGGLAQFEPARYDDPALRKFSAENVEVVADASLTVEEGEICVLMGLSGSGKSTLLRAVNGLNKVSRGKVMLKHRGDMVDIAKIDADTLRAVRTESVAMVFQQFALLPWRTVRENIDLALPQSGSGDWVAHLLEIMDLTRWQNQYPQKLSGGMARRVALVRAFGAGPGLRMDSPGRS